MTRESSETTAIPPLATARSDRAFKVAQSEPRTPSFGVYQPIYNLRDLPQIYLERPSGIRVQEMISSYNANNRGSERGRGGLARRPDGSGSGALRQGRPCALRQLQNPESGARALRHAIWETVHVSIDLQMKGARDDSL
eukprot:6197294-Pleurochrysis_carterae.AAC.2